MAVASAGLYASLPLAPDRQPCQQLTTQFFTGWMPWCCPTNSVQALKGYDDTKQYDKNSFPSKINTVCDNRVSNSYVEVSRKNSPDNPS